MRLRRIAVFVLALIFVPTLALGDLSVDMTQGQTGYDSSNGDPIVSENSPIVITVTGDSTTYGVSYKNSNADSFAYISWTFGPTGTWDDSFTSGNNGTVNLLIVDTATFVSIVDNQGTVGNTVKLEYEISN